MKFKDYVKAGFGVCVGIWLAKVTDFAAAKILEAITDKPEPEKETKIETEE